MAIPGVKTIIKDRFYSISRQDIPVGPKICLIARRSTDDNEGNVRDLDVVQATTEEDVITAFGENSDAHRGFFELIAGGAERIFIVPLPSDTTWNYSSGEVDSDDFGGTPAELLDAIFEAAESIQPDIIVVLGKTAAVSLLGLPAETSLASLRGKAHHHAGLPLIVTYHPADLLRQPADKGQSWRDLCLAMSLFNGR